MKKIAVIISITALVFLGLSSGAFCQGRSGGGYHGGGYYGRGGYYYGGGPYFSFGWPFGFPYYTNPYGYYPYGYSYSYPYAYGYPDQNYPSTYEESLVYLEPEQPYSWYYCKDAQAYYPYVTNCPGGWTEVAPTPPGKEG